MRMPEVLDNVSRIVNDDLAVTISNGDKLSIAAACFSMYAYQNLKKQLDGIAELRFIFTSPTFLQEKMPKEKREFYIPRLDRERCDKEELPYDPAEFPDDESDDNPQTGIFIGKTAAVTASVTDQNTAKAVGSGTLDVFATPMMIALMERAACECLADAVEPGRTSVGTSVNIEHTSVRPLGAEITAMAVIVGVDGKKIEFEVSTSDAKGEIDRGTHERVVVDAERFMSKVKVKI
jgi:predicted thioesterase